MKDAAPQSSAPLASRMRPRVLDELIGQEEAVGKGSAFFKALQADELPSLIIWGPPGSGKTSFATIVAGMTGAAYVHESAVACGTAEIRLIDGEAAKRLAETGQRTILFLDEIHRFNKAQQDRLLPAVEDGRIVLIGATTENPYHEVNSALLSRSTLLRFRSLSPEEIISVLESALGDEERGLGGKGADVTAEALELIAHSSGGDARTALNALELAVGSAAGSPVGPEEARSALGESAVLYDKDGDFHYDLASAFIKSMRGSDPDAALYWMARMLNGGEDPKFIARRMVIFSSEDIGNADPHALLVATAAAQAVQFVGLPECRINLAQACAYLSCAPKSNASYVAVDEAMRFARESAAAVPPGHLRDASYPGAKALGHGKGYKYPHAYPGHHVSQGYMPAGVPEERFYRPDGEGYEKNIVERLKKWRDE